MNRSKKFLYNTVCAASYQIVLLVVGFITPRYMLKYYGSEINGLITSITQFITYFNLVEAGLASASIYALYKPLAEDNKRQISSIVVATQRFYIISGYIFLGLILGLAFIYPVYISVKGLNYSQIFALVLILGFSGVLEFFTLGKYRALLTADQKLYVISIASILYMILNTVIVIKLAVLGMNIVIIKGIAISSILLRTVILYCYAKKRYPYIDYTAKADNTALNKRWDALYLQILGAIHTGAPVVLATIFTDLKSVSVYSIYNMVMGGVSGIVSVFINGLSASFGDVIARNQSEVLKKAYQEFEFAYYSLITVIYGVSFILIMPFIRLYTTNINDTNYNIPFLGMLFVINGLLYNLKTPQGMLVISAGHYKETKLQTSIQGALAVILGTIGALRFGLAGILLGTIISNLYRTIDLLFYVPTKITYLPIRNSILRMVNCILELVIICAPFFYIQLEISTYIAWITVAIITTIYACLVVVCIGYLFNKNQFHGILERLNMVRK